MKALVKLSFFGAMPQPSRRGSDPFPTAEQRAGMADDRMGSSSLAREIVGGLSGGLAGLGLFYLLYKNKGISSGSLYDEFPMAAQTFGTVGIGIGTSLASSTKLHR